MDFTSQKFLMGAAGAGGIDAWLTTIDNSGLISYQAGRKLGQITTSEDIYVAGRGYFPSGGRYVGYAIQLTNDGAVTRYEDCGNSQGTVMEGLVIGGDAHPISYGWDNNGYTNRQEASYYRWNDSLTLQTDQVYGPNNASQYTYCYAADTDSTNDYYIYQGGYVVNTGGIWAMNTANNTILGQKTVSPANAYCYGIHIPSGATYGWYMFKNTSAVDVRVARVDNISLGVFQSTTIDDSVSGNVQDAFAITENSSGNGVCAFTCGTSSRDLGLAEIDGSTAAAVQSKVFTTGATVSYRFDIIESITCDAADNYYVSGSLFDSGIKSGYALGFLAKFDSSFDLLWINVGVHSTASTYFRGTKEATDGGILMSGQGGDTIYVAKFDGSGSGAGTYGSLTIQSYTSSVSIGTNNLTIVTGGITIANNSRSNNNVTTSTSTVTPTVNTYTL